MNSPDQAIERGADDFLSKPFDASRLRVTLSNAAQRLELTQKLTKLGETRERLGPMYGRSTVMQAVYTTIESLASSRATAMITGESGTGKELAAGPSTICPPGLRGPLSRSIVLPYPMTD